MNKYLLSSTAILLSFSLISCGGSGGSTGSSGGSTGSSGGGTGSSGGGTGGSGGGTGGSNTPKTDVLLDLTKNYPALSSQIREHLRITETHQNKANTTKYNLWDYSYSPTKINNRVIFESYESNQFSNSDIYRALSSEEVYEYNPRLPVNSENSRKLTFINHNGNESSIGGITYDTKSALIFNKQNELIDIKITKEPELISAGLQKANRDFCSDDVPTGEIHFKATGRGFWQLGDSHKINIDTNGPVISCDSNDNASIIGQFNSTTLSTDTLKEHHSVLSLRGRDFHNVLEFNNLQTTKAAGKIVHESFTKTYVQFYTGRIAETETSCIGGAIGDSNAICTTTDEVATNMPSIPEI